MPGIIEGNQLVEQIKQDLADNKLQLPTLPEIALRVRDAAENENISTHELAELISEDAALSARLLQVANSPLYRARTPIDNIQAAVTRLGNKLIRSLVISLVMKQIFQPTSDALDHLFRKVWHEGLEVAAISRALATMVPEIETEQGMLAGLVHNIGALPILARIDERYGFEAEIGTVQQLLKTLAPSLGRHILQSWNFPPDMAAVPEGCLDLYRDSGPKADYSDVVLVARLQYQAMNGDSSVLGDWSRIPAFAKIGLETDITVVDMGGAAEEISETRFLLDG